MRLRPHRHQQDEKPQRPVHGLLGAGFMTRVRAAPAVRKECCGKFCSETAGVQRWRRGGVRALKFPPGAEEARDMQERCPHLDSHPESLPAFNLQLTRKLRWGPVATRHVSGVRGWPTPRALQDRCRTCRGAGASLLPSSRVKLASKGRKRLQGLEKVLELVARQTHWHCLAFRGAGWCCAPAVPHTRMSTSVWSRPHATSSITSPSMSGSSSGKGASSNIAVPKRPPAAAPQLQEGWGWGSSSRSTCAGAPCCVRATCMCVYCAGSRPAVLVHPMLQGSAYVWRFPRPHSLAPIHAARSKKKKAGKAKHAQRTCSTWCA